jgi:hypothetical protein
LPKSTRPRKGNGKPRWGGWRQNSSTGSVNLFSQQ